MIKVKRVYEPASDDDGKRILVDRLWPRGLKKDAAKIDLWLRDIAPSDSLRKWFMHDPSKWEQFKIRYAKELFDKKQIVDRIKSLERENNTVTLLFSSKEERYNNAVALRDYIKSL
ncbi:MAG: DUF488 family protein [Nitrososphaerota archaeon]